MTSQRIKTLWLYSVGSIASVLVVIDAGAFYDQFAEIKGIGYTQAFLLEIFLAITAGTWILHDKWNIRNVVIKFLMLCLFLLSVATSALQVTLPEIESLNKIINQQEVSKILRSSIEDSRVNQEWLKEKKQTTNTILTTRKIQESREELTSLLLKQKSETGTILKITSLFLLKFLLQASNLLIFSLAGRLSRSEEEKSSNAIFEKFEKFDQEEKIVSQNDQSLNTEIEDFENVDEKVHRFENVDEKAQTLEKEEVEEIQIFSEGEEEISFELQSVTPENGDENSSDESSKSEVKFSNLEVKPSKTEPNPFEGGEQKEEETFGEKNTLSMKELVEKHNIKQGQIAVALSCHKSAVSATLNHYEKIHAYLKETFPSETQNLR